MPFNHTLSAILRGRWMLDHQWANDHLPLVLMMLQGKPLSFTQQQPKSTAVQRSGVEQFEQPFAIDPATMQRQALYILNEATWRYMPNPNLAPNSVGVLPITGPCTKYDGECGEPGMITRTNWLIDLMNRQNIGSIIQLMDTPGGEARAASSYVSVLQSRSKPVLTYNDGMTASLGVWFSSNSDEFYFSNEMDQVGSIGSYCTLFDFSGYLEQNGIKMTNIYAPQSTDKNKDYRDAIAGDTSAIAADLGKHVDAFKASVKNGRPKAAAFEKDWGTGKMFYAGEAQKIGLADGVKPFDQVVSKAAWLGKRYKK